MAGLTGWPAVAALDEGELEARLYPSQADSKLKGWRLRPAPDWAELRAELARRDHQVTLALLWQEYKAEQPDGYLIMLASAMPGEGKTFTAINLALTIASEKDLRVLLVDADAAKPHLSRILGLEGELGLLDLLRDSQLDVGAVIRPTDVPTLSFLAAGRSSTEATELLASKRMEGLAALLGQRDGHRIVLFDTPPLMQTTESPVLVQVAGQVLVVVRAESTPQPVLLDVLEILQEIRLCR